jgi:large subunit ribosomal protein L29
VTKQIEAVNLLRTMSAEELDEHLHEQRRRLFEVRFQQAAGQVDNHRQIRDLRREIARTMTIQVELAHGHRLASEAALESGAAEPEPEDRLRRRRLFRRGAAPAGGEAATTATSAVEAPAQEEPGEFEGGEDFAEPEAAEGPWVSESTTEPEAVEETEEAEEAESAQVAASPEATEEPEAMESPELEGRGTEDAAGATAEEATPEGSSDAATENG